MCLFMRMDFVQFVFFVDRSYSSWVNVSDLAFWEQAYKTVLYMWIHEIQMDNQMPQYSSSLCFSFSSLSSSARVSLELTHRAPRTHTVALRGTFPSFMQTKPLRTYFHVLHWSATAVCVSRNSVLPELCFSQVDLQRERRGGNVRETDGMMWGIRCQCWKLL